MHWVLHMAYVAVADLLQPLFHYPQALCAEEYVCCLDVTVCGIASDTHGPAHPSVGDPLITHLMEFPTSVMHITVR